MYIRYVNYMCVCVCVNVSTCEILGGEGGIFLFDKKTIFEKTYNKSYHNSVKFE